MSVDHGNISPELGLVLLFRTIGNYGMMGLFRNAFMGRWKLDCRVNYPAQGVGVEPINLVSRVFAPDDLPFCRPRHVAVQSYRVVVTANARW